jgi:hypothetical protein
MNLIARSISVLSSASLSDFDVKSEEYMQCMHATGHSSVKWMKKLEPVLGI